MTWKCKSEPVIGKDLGGYQKCIYANALQNTVFPSLHFICAKYEEWEREGVIQSHTR